MVGRALQFRVVPHSFGLASAKLLGDVTHLSGASHSHHDTARAWWSVVSITSNARKNSFVTPPLMYRPNVGLKHYSIYARALRLVRFSLHRETKAGESMSLTHLSSASHSHHDIAQLDDPSSRSHRMPGKTLVGRLSAHRVCFPIEAKLMPIAF